MNRMGNVIRNTLRVNGQLVLALILIGVADTLLLRAEGPTAALALRILPAVELLVVCGFLIYNLYTLYRALYEEAEPVSPRGAVVATVGCTAIYYLPVVAAHVIENLYLMSLMPGIVPWQGWLAFAAVELTMLVQYMTVVYVGGALLAGLRRMTPGWRTAVTAGMLVALALYHRMMVGTFAAWLANLLTPYAAHPVGYYLTLTAAALLLLLLPCLLCDAGLHRLNRNHSQSALDKEEN